MNKGAEGKLDNNQWSIVEANVKIVPIGLFEQLNKKCVMVKDYTI